MVPVTASAVYRRVSRITAGARGKPGMALGRKVAPPEVGGTKRLVGRVRPWAPEATGVVHRWI